MHFARPCSVRGAAGAPVYRGQVLRTALRPKWLALLALALALASGFAWLGTWQLERSRVEAVTTDGTVPAGPVPLPSVLDPQEPLTGEAARTAVVATGRFEGEPLLVRDRVQDGSRGYWLLAALVVPSDPDADPARLPVVLGWLPDGEAVDRAQLPQGELSVTGRLRPSEAPAGPPSGGQVSAVSSADLVNLWGAPMYSAYLLAGSEAASAAGVTAVPPPPDEGSGFALHNLSYALQWWAFAGFAVFLWWRMVRDEHLHPQDAAAEPVRSTDA